MDDHKKERWEDLAEQVAKETDTQKLLKLTKELDEALAAKTRPKDKGQSMLAA